MVSQPTQFWDADYNGANLYTGQPNGWAPYSNWTMWQVSSTGSIPGVSGDVDLDTYNGDINAMISGSGVVSSAGAKFNNGDTIHTTANQKAWNTYASNGTYVTIPSGTSGVVQSGTPVFINGFERVEVKWSGSSSDTWVADNLESEGAGSAGAAMTATVKPTIVTAGSSSSPSADNSVLGSSSKGVLG